MPRRASLYNAGATEEASLFLLLWACSTGPSEPATPPPAVFDREATDAAIDALCKLYEGADLPCERGSDGLTSGDTTLGVKAEIQPAEVSLGMVSIRGVVHIETPEGTYSSHLTGFGGTKSEGLQRSTHEWAVVSAVSVVDLVVDPATRPALAKLEPGPPAPLTLAGHAVLRGWALVRPEQELDHNGLLKALGPGFEGRDPKGFVNLEVTRQAGEVSVSCWFQGEPDEALCAAARAWAWPEREYELRVGYLVR
ncbi:MAG: hypothetical protein R3F61_34185 [Myxococcota bacterium]